MIISACADRAMAESYVMKNAAAIRKARYLATRTLWLAHARKDGRARNVTSVRRTGSLLGSATRFAKILRLVTARVLATL